MTTRSLFLSLAALALSGCMVVDLGSLGSKELEEVTVEKAGGRLVSDKILLADISGEIGEGADGGLFGGLVCSPHYVRAVLKRAEEDRRVRAVVLRIDSPGGAVGASERVAREVDAFRRRCGKPVIAHIGGLGCSGAFYLASAADAVHAEPSSICGSIGVIAILPQLSKLAGKIGYEQTVIKSGALKDMGSPLRDLTDEERRVFQDLIMSDYEGFVAFVAARRPQIGGPDRLRPLADGRVFTSAQALDHRLIDRVCFLDESIDAAKKAAGIRDAAVVSYAYDVRDDANLYTPAGSAAAPGPLKLNLALPPALRTRGGLFYLWLPGE